MPKKQKSASRVDELKTEFLRHATDLWDKRGMEIVKVLDQAESRKLNATFTAAMDFSESTAKITTTVSFSQVHKDKRVTDFMNPDLPGMKGEEDEEDEQ